MRVVPLPLVLALTLAAQAAQAQDAELDALKLADDTADQMAEQKVAPPAPARWFAEFMAGGAQPRAAGQPVAAIGRLSLDLQWDQSLASSLRFVLADRLDLSAQQRPSAHDGVNTLKEVYLSWQPQPDRFLDFGRINVRNGVATGYNPTDYFRDGAVRSLTSIDPASLRANRMGTAMLRGQFLWPNASFTAMVSPKLSAQPSDAVFSPDFGATNHRTRWLLAFSQRITDDLNPQFLLYGNRPGDVRAGLNLATLVNDATVAFIEWSAGRRPSQLSQALGTAGEAAIQHQVATGLTTTTANKLSLTLEYHHNGAGLSRSGWDALRAGSPAASPAAYGRYRQWTQTAQELPTRQRVFARAMWQDFVIDRLDWSVMLSHTIEDRSRRFWTELRYRWDSTELALQWQSNHGERSSDFGAAPIQRSLQLSLRQFF